MPVDTLTDHTKVQALVTGVNVALNPTARYCSRVQLKNDGPGIAYVGVQGPNGVGSAVTSSSYDIMLGAGEGQMFGWGDVDLGGTYHASDTDNNKLSWLPETY